MPDVHELVAPILSIHEEMRDAVVAACEAARATAEAGEMAALTDIEHDGAGDTIYAIDRISEARLMTAFETHVASRTPIMLIAEGLPDGGRVVLPRGAREKEVAWRIIVDPIDGTRGLMYQKRSAWILTGVAPNRGERTALSDITLAVQSEIPLVKQHLMDQIWAIRGETVRAQRINRLDGTRSALRLHPSQADTIAHGFATIARFFPGGRDLLAAIDDEVVATVLGPVRPGKGQCFEDQYICTGGQFYELLTGHDRFIADLRPLVERVLAERGQALGLCCHPYDVCTALIAEELGVILTDPEGNPLDAPLAIEPDVAWVGYANDALRAQVAPALEAALERRGWLRDAPSSTGSSAAAW